MPTMVNSQPVTRLTPIKISLKPTLEVLTRDFGITDKELSSALKVDPRTFERWESGERFPRPAAIDAIQELIALHERLADTFETSEGMRQWLHSPLPFLGKMAPIDAVKVGRSQLVAAALEAIDDGFAS